MSDLCPRCSYQHQGLETCSRVPEPVGRTANALRECVTNLALGKRVYYVVHEMHFASYCVHLLAHVAHLRGFPECRRKSETEFALKNGGATLKFISINDPAYSLHVHGFGCRRDAVLFEDHYAWAGLRR